MTANYDVCVKGRPWLKVYIINGSPESYLIIYNFKYIFYLVQ